MTESLNHRLHNNPTATVDRFQGGDHTMTPSHNSQETNSPWRLLIMLVAVLALVVAACGGDDDSSDDAASEETEAADDSGSEETTDDSGSDEGSGDDIVLAFARFFGDCEEDVAGVTDVSQATTECEVIQIIENAFNAEDNGIRVEKIGGQAWGDYYTQLTTAFAGGELPVVGVMHQHRLPDFAGRGLLMPLDDAFANSDVIDFADYTAPAQDAAQLNGTTYALPFDIHASLWHVNVDLFEAAGLTDADGNPIAPTSPDELYEQCEAIEAATDAQCFGHDWFEFGVGARLFLGLVQQQGGSLTDDSGVATPNTAEGKEALAVLNRLAEYSDVTQGYTDSQSAFLNGDIAILHNGTWVVDQYSREAGFNYMATNVPTLYDTPSVWGDSHMWVLPMASNEDPEVNAAAVTFLEFLYENIPGWAKGTGHIAPLTSVLNSDELADAPQRANYADTASNAGLVPAVEGWAGAWDALAEEVNATWVTGKDQDTALADAEARMNDALG
jgi:multiple sugar transport system substrate-binding protein